MTEKLHVKQLNTLLKLEPQLGTKDEQTLSVYMPVRAEGFDVRHYDVILEHVAGPYRQKLDDDQKKVLDRELPRFRTHLHLVRPAGCPAIAFFSNDAIALIHAIRLPESIEARIEVGPPLLAPLELMLKRYPPALVSVVDKEHGRTFASILGELIPLAEVNGQEVRHIRSGGTSAPSNQRRADNRARANLKQVAASIEAEVKRNGFTRLYVAGPDEARTALIRLLPKPIASLVSGSISASLDTPGGRLLADVRDQMLTLNRASAVSA
jgi:hypothetical protein